MAAVLSGAGGASCQMCTATHKYLKDKDLVVDVFPINRTITDARQLFSDIEDTDSFRRRKNIASNCRQREPCVTRLGLSGQLNHLD